MLYYDYIDNLDPEEENFETANIRIPENTPTGNYYMLWKADATDMDDESNENNNVAVQPIFVTASTGKTHHQESTEMLSTQLKVNAAPNPFAETTTIEYTLDKPSTVFVDIYDVTGKKVAQLVEGEDQTEGKQTMSFEATDLPDGLYFCQVKIGDRQETIRILLQR